MTTGVKVLIATPAYDGKVSAYYLDSMLRLSRELDFHQMAVCYDSLVQRARNDIFKMFIEGGYDYLIMIDADQGFEPSDVLRNLGKTDAVVAAPIRKKSDNVEWNVVWSNVVPVEGYAKVEGVGTGFMIVPRDVGVAVWNMSPAYKSDPSQHDDCRMVFNIGINDDDCLVSEDIMFCNKVRHNGFDVLVDQDAAVTHYGPDGKGYYTNFREFIKGLRKA